MTRLQLSLAIGDYDRTRPLLDGGVQIDGVAPRASDFYAVGDDMRAALADYGRTQ